MISLWMERSHGHLFDDDKDTGNNRASACHREVNPEISLYEASKSLFKAQVDSSLLKLPPMTQILPNLSRRNLHPLLNHAFFIENIFTKEECGDIIRQIESIGLTKWTNDESRLSFRDCDTIEIHHEELAQLIWERMKPALNNEELECEITPESDRYQRDLIGRWIAFGTVNDLLFSRYNEGNHFAIHTDGFNIESFDCRSMFSIVIYLNDLKEGEGGETVFYGTDRNGGMMLRDPVTNKVIGDPSRILASERPKAGSATVFYHNIFHQSQPIAKGNGAKKYIIRSDIMYKRTPPLAVDKVDIEAFEMYQQAEFVCDQDPQESARLFQLAFKKSGLLSRIYGA